MRTFAFFFASLRALPRSLAPLLAASAVWLAPSTATAQLFDLFAAPEPPSRQGSPDVTREDLPPAAPFEERQRGVVREELDPVMAADGSGLPHELWSGLSAKDLAGHIAALELPPRSPSLNALWRRLVAADASVAAGGATPVRFTALRIEILDQSGLIDEAAVVLARDPASTSDPLLMALTARSEIGLGNDERGCELARGLLAIQASLPGPNRADALLISGYCAARHGDMTGAALQAGLLRELDLGNLGGASLLDAVASGIAPEIPAGTKLTLLDYRIAALADSIDRAKLVQAASPALLAGLASDPRAAPDVRLAAGEAAAAINAIPARDLAALYRAEGAGGDAGTIERAGLFRSAEGERGALNKARLIRAFLDEARRAGLYWPALQLMAEPTQALAPVPEIGWFAETAAEIHLATGNFEGVRSWARFSGSHDSLNPAAAQPLAHWIALADIVDPGLGTERSRHLSSVEAMALDGRFDPALLHRLATVLDALDVNVPIPLWDLASRAPQPVAGHLPDTGILSELAEAARKKELGKTVILVLRTLGPNGPEGAHMIALGDSIRALRRAGLEAEARQLALEGLFAAWPRAVSQ